MQVTELAKDPMLLALSFILFSGLYDASLYEFTCVIQGCSV